MRILAIDVGTGTQDIMIYDTEKELENSIKLVLPSPHLYISQQIKEIENDERNLEFSIKTNKYLAPLMYTVPFQFVAAKGAKDIHIDTAINPFKVQLAHLPENND